MARGQRTYEQDEIRLGLLYLAKAAGREREASRRLKRERGLTIPHTTLTGWKNRSHPELYADILRQNEQVRREEMAEEVIAVNQKELHAANLSVDRLITALENDEIAAKDLPKALRDVKLSFGIGTDKANVLLDRPTEIVEKRADWGQMSAALRVLLKMPHTDSTADDISDEPQDALVVGDNEKGA